MANTSLKNLRMKAQEIVQNGVTTRDALNAALPVLVKLKEALEAARANLKGSALDFSDLSEICTRYAEKHPGCFEGSGLVPNQMGVLSGIVEDESENRYKLVIGYNGYERTNGETITQKFLASLPKGWTKTKLELSTTAINSAAVTDGELEKAGLQQKTKAVWSLVEEI